MLNFIMCGKSQNQPQLFAFWVVVANEIDYLDKAGFNEIDYLCRVKIPKPRVSCSKSRCSKSRFQIPIASLMFTVKFPKPASHLQSSSPEINWSGVE